MPNLEESSVLDVFAEWLPKAATLEVLYEKVLAENSHARAEALKVLRTEVFPEPYEEGTNVGEVELELNAEGNRAIYGVYNVEPHFQCFMN